MELKTNRGQEEKHEKNTEKTDAVKNKKVKHSESKLNVINVTSK